MNAFRPTPAVSLKELLNRLQLIEPGQRAFIDQQTGAVVQREEGRGLADSDRLTPVDAQWEESELNWARRFVANVTNEVHHGRLRMALSSDDPLAAFESCVYRCEIAHRWYRFRDEQWIRAAREWLESRGFSYLDDVAAGSP